MTKWDPESIIALCAIFLIIVMFSIAFIVAGNIIISNNSNCEKLASLIRGGQPHEIDILKYKKECIKE